MCGIVGLAVKTQSGLSYKDAVLFEELLFIDTLRGDDSTGVAAFHNDGELEMLKDRWSAPFFLDSTEWSTFRQRTISKGKALIGHNRKKTVGKVEAETAHPFVVHDRYAFVHNGTLRNHKKLADTEVDSEALALVLTPLGHDPEKLQEQLAEVDGTYACAWLDKDHEKLFLLRNSERPLFIADTSIGYVFASESPMLIMACLRNGVKLTHDSIKEIPVNTLVEIDLNDYQLKRKDTELKITKKSYPLSTKITKRSTRAMAVTGGMEKRGTATKQHYTESANDLDTEGTSKNAFKRFRNRAIGQRISFLVVDYVEKVIGDDDPSSWRLFGEAKDLSLKHTLHVGLEGVKTRELVEDYYQRMVNAKITNVEWNNQTRTVNIYVDDLKKGYVLGSVSNHEATAALH